MSRWTTLTLEEAGAICTVTLSRPEHGNRINVQMVRELEEMCDYLDEESPSSVVVFRGAGGQFTEGIEMSDFSVSRPPDIHGFNKWERSIAAIERLKKVTVAVIEGRCHGAGVQIALACDFRIASREAVLVTDEVKQGFLPGMATFRIAKYVGMAAARHIVLAGRPLGADEARELRLINRVCEGENLKIEIERAAMEFMPVNGKVVALARRLLNESYSNTHEDFLGNFLAAQQVAITSEPFIRILQAALREP